jgi:hypothetical protein
MGEPLQKEARPFSADPPLFLYMKNAVNALLLPDYPGLGSPYI